MDYYSAARLKRFINARSDVTFWSHKMRISHLLILGENQEVEKEANKVYETLSKMGIEVLFDDRREVTAGEKFADSDLLGIPMRAVVSERSIKEGGIEIKKRTEEKGKILTLPELIKLCNK